MRFINNVLSRLKLRTKLWSLVLIALFGMVLLTATSLFAQKQQMLLDRQNKTRNIVEVSHGVLAYFEQQVQAGALSREAAQAEAKTVIKGLRYDEAEYLWINDMEPRMVMHPYKPELDGKDVRNNKDPAGKQLFMEFVRTVQEQGAGFVDYLWPKPGFDAPVRKISYVKGFAPWGWIIGSGIYLDDVDLAFWNSTRNYLTLVGGFALVLLISSLIVTLNINRSTRAFDLAINRVKNDSDLSVRVDIEGRDELAQVGGLVNTLLENFHDALKRVKHSIGGLRVAVDRMGEITENMGNGVRRQQLETDQVATAVNEMAATVQDVARNAAATADATQKADEEASGGRQVVARTIESIDRLAHEVQQATGVIRKLAADSHEIGSVVDVINGIAEQTNLLALNAAIEAARAGEQGRGFAVVADEVRTLAKRTQDSTNEIQAMVERLQAAAERAVQAMDQGSKQAEGSVKQAASAGQSLEAIARAVAAISQMSSQIATAAEEQGVVAEEINKNIANITHVADQTTEEAKRTAGAGEELARLASELQLMVVKYVV